MEDRDKIELHDGADLTHELTTVIKEDLSPILKGIWNMPNPDEAQGLIVDIFQKNYHIFSMFTSSALELGQDCMAGTQISLSGTPYKRAESLMSGFLRVTYAGDFIMRENDLLLYQGQVFSIKDLDQFIECINTYRQLMTGCDIYERDKSKEFVDVLAKTCDRFRSSHYADVGITTATRYLTAAINFAIESQMIAVDEMSQLLTNSTMPGGGIHLLMNPGAADVISSPYDVALLVDHGNQDIVLRDKMFRLDMENLRISPTQECKVYIQSTRSLTPEHMKRRRRKGCPAMHNTMNLGEEGSAYVPILTRIVQNIHFVD